ncbi:STAS domain-containing protein [Candidatus Albibeggiatoa sp. nov. NOAA]|uniref:slr1659 superfamily regulator n=1 Tax=Candidatus Albibeggiatoa sp. nov. NOAA TaxID=3162724 RepID=UPI0033027143|nr:hypothetical protein [Thiotrichaceae bacterium]
MNELKSDTYSIWYDAEAGTIYCKGTLRLRGIPDYQPVAQLFTQVIEKEPANLTLDVTGLEFLNSSGIHVLSKFIIGVRQKKTIEMLMRCSNEIPWQGKSLKNVQRLMPAMQTEWV